MKKIMSGENIFLANDLKQYFQEIKKFKLLSHEDEIDLAKKSENGDKNAFDRLVKSNLRLVIKIAKRYITPEWKFSDLIQEGNIGLLKSVEKFDYRKNVRFATYASWWIKQSITRSISNKRRTIRLPHRKEEKLRKINLTIEKLYQEFSRKPRISEIAEALCCEEIDILNLKNISEKIISIDAELNEDGSSIINILDDEKNSPELLFEKNNLQRETEDVLNQLKEKERAVLKSRFAFDNNKETLKSIADNLGLSMETVRQIEIKAIRKIKENYSYLKDFLYM